MERGTELVRAEHQTAVVVYDGPGLVQPIAELAQIRQTFLAYQECVEALLVPSDYQQIGSKSFKKKSAWRKLATAFGLSASKIGEEDTYGPDGRIRRSKRTVRATAPNGRSMDGEGVCDIFERCCEPGCARSHEHCAAARSETCPGWIHFSHAEHDIPSTAFTRALNRAFADLIGAGEVSAEEVVGEGEGDALHRRLSPHNGGGKPNIIKSKYAGVCAGCGGNYAVGDPIEWVKGRKDVYHEACVPGAKAHQEVEAFSEPSVNDEIRRLGDEQRAKDTPTGRTAEALATYGSMGKFQIAARSALGRGINAEDIDTLSEEEFGRVMGAPWGTP